MSKLRQITVVTDQDGTEALYVDGELYEQDQTIYAVDIALAAGRDPVMFVHRGIDELVGRWPQLLSDVPDGDET